LLKESFTRSQTAGWRLSSPGCERRRGNDGAPRRARRNSFPLRDFLKALRSLWSHFRLDRYASPTAREELLLRGQLITKDLSNQERLAFLALADVAMLNAFGESSPALETFEDLLRRLVDIVPPADVRAALWGAMLGGTADAELRDEIRLAAPGLRAVIGAGPAESAWTSAAIEGLRAAASRSGDKVISELVQQVEGDPHPLLGIALWAERLESVEQAQTETLAQPAQQPEAHPASHEPQPPDETLPAAVSPSAVLPGHDSSVSASWAVTKALGNLDLFAACIGDVREAADRMLQESALDRPEAVLETVGRLDALRAAVQECLEQIPPRPQLERDLAEAMRVNAAACSVLGNDLDPSSVPFSGLSVAELDELVRLLDTDDERLARLPSWVWSDAENHDAAPQNRHERSRALCTPSIRRSAQQMLDIFEDYADVPLSAVARIRTGGQPASGRPRFARSSNTSVMLRNDSSVSLRSTAHG
jgi:hypothetical protein